jgi:hypothetical protein
MGGENFISRFNKIIDIVSDRRNVAIAVRDPYIITDGGQWHNIFYGGRALFFAETLGTLHKSEMRNMEANFGLLPMPKYNEAQEHYICTVLETGWALGIPISATNTERTGLILEALAAESHVTVIPAYYELALEFKLTRDEESVQMLDIIRANRIYDLASVYRFGNVAADLRGRISRDDRNIVSYIESIQVQVGTAIENTVNALRIFD